MIDNDIFISIPSAERPEAHRREAARIRALIGAATTSAIRRHLEDRACAHDRLAGPDPE